MLNLFGQNNIKMKLENLNKEIKKEKKKMVYVDTDVPIYKEIDDKTVNSKKLVLKKNYHNLFPNIKDDVLEVRNIKLSDLKNMKAWVVYFKNILDNPYLLHYFKPYDL